MEIPGQGAVSNRVAPYAPVSVTIICMFLSLKRLALAAVLLVLPLQGVAATLSVLPCSGDAQMHAMHANGGHDRGTDQNSGLDDGSTSGNSADRPCHNTVYAPLFVTLLAATPDFPVRAFAPDTLYDPFIPEQPQRPPLV